MTETWPEYLRRITDGQTQTQIAERIGIARLPVGNWLHGKTRPKAETAIAVAQTYQRPPVEALLAAAYLEPGGDPRGAVAVPASVPDRRHKRSLHKREIIVKSILRAFFSSLVSILMLLGFTEAAHAEPGLSGDEVEFLKDITYPRYRDVPPIVPTAGHSMQDLARLGRVVATHVRHGVDTLDVQPWIERNNPTLTSKQAALFVISATRIWAPDFLEWYWGCGNGPTCEQVMPRGAVTTPWGNPADLLPAYRYPPG